MSFANDFREGRGAVDPRRQALGWLLGAGIVFLVACNGFFTFSGARLYIHEPLYAILFAVAVQFAIAAALLALPWVRGFGRLVMLVVYVAALALSTLSAFTYIYNTSLPEGRDVHALDTHLKATLSTELSEAFKGERDHVAAQRQALAEMRRAVQEEAERGLHSGKGPGKGREYYTKLEAYQAAADRFADLERRFAAASATYREISERLARPGGGAEEREGLIVLFSRLAAQSALPQTGERLKEIVAQQLGTLRNPVERAINDLLDHRNYSVTLIVSAIWAAIFDLLALFIGVVRYYLLRPDYSLFARLHDGLVGLATFLLRLGHVRQEARARYRTQGLPAAEPLNSPEMQNFATYLLAGSQLAQEEGSENDPTEPLRTLTGFIEPLALDKPKNSVGIPYETIHTMPRLKTLLAMLVQSGVFINDLRRECYILNASADAAQKVMVFLRLGMKDQPEKLEQVRFMLGEQPPLPSA